MNAPGKQVDNWGWRFARDDLLPAHAERLAELTALYERGRTPHPVSAK